MNAWAYLSWPPKMASTRSWCVAPLSSGACFTPVSRFSSMLWRKVITRARPV